MPNDEFELHPTHGAFFKSVHTTVCQELGLDPTMLPGSRDIRKALQALRRRTVEAEIAHGALSPSVMRLLGVLATLGLTDADIEALTFIVGAYHRLVQLEQEATAHPWVMSKPGLLMEGMDTFVSQGLEDDPPFASFWPELTGQPDGNADAKFTVVVRNLLGAAFEARRLSLRKSGAKDTIPA